MEVLKKGSLVKVRLKVGLVKRDFKVRIIGPLFESSKFKKLNSERCNILTPMFTKDELKEAG